MERYPALYLPALHKVLPLNEGSSIVGREGDIAVPDITCSRRQFAVHISAGGAMVESLSESVPTLLNNRPLAGRAPLTHGDAITAGQTLFKFLAGPDESVSPGRKRRDGAGAPSPPQATILGHFDGERSPLTEEILLKGNGFIGRDSERSVYLLDHLRVSRRHAELRVTGDAVYLRDAGSSNGTFLNGERVAGWRQLRQGDRIDIGPFSVKFTGRSFVQSTRDKNLRIAALALTRTVHAEADGKPTRILHDVSLVIQPNEFVCILGPSGSGKSTLMRALSARAPANAGNVLLNDEDLYSNFEALKQSIALVPQKDVLYENLTLQEALEYTARLRLPPDTALASIQQSVTQSIERVDLTHRAGTRIANLSGGQKKRASLANETVARPNLLFLDEVTSGLDEGTDWEMMRLFRRMADDGMTVICVTHSLANVEDFCHKMIVMASPGVLAFYGTPAEARAYFDVTRLGDIYRRLAGTNGEAWQQKYRTTPQYREYVGNPLRGITPPPAKQMVPEKQLEVALAWPESRRQFGIVAGRYAKLMLADRETLAIAGLQSATIGALLVMIYGRLTASDPNAFSLAFFLGISCFWYGCNNASKEIVKEYDIYRLERDVNLAAPAYLLSKMVLLTALGAIQALILFGIVHKFSTVPGDAGHQLLNMLTTIVTGTAAGLLISAGARSPDQASTLVPIILIPQIVLAGVIVRDLPKAPDMIAHVAISGFWVYRAMESTVLGTHGKSAEALGVLALHAAVFLAAALILLIRRESAAS